VKKSTQNVLLLAVYHGHGFMVTFEEKIVHNCSTRKATLVAVVVKGPKIPKAFLIRSGVQRNFAYTFVLTLPTDLPSQIFHLFSN